MSILVSGVSTALGLTDESGFVQPELRSRWVNYTGMSRFLLLTAAFRTKFGPCTRSDLCSF
jgi:hypothetical protein